MERLLQFRKSFVFVSMACLLLSACTKDMAKKDKLVEVTEKAAGKSKKVTVPFKMKSDTWYRFVLLTNFTPLEEDDTKLGFAHVPGGGTGNATHMGNIETWFNQLAYNPDANFNPEGSVGASVSIFASAPPDNFFLNYPEGDFDALIAANSWLNIPATVDGKIVNAVIYNHKGDAVFTANTTPSVTQFISPTRVNFSGKGVFVGGRGKFAQATGTFGFTGYFNPQNPEDAGYYLDGSITY